MKTIKKVILYLVRSRGFSPPRVIFTLVYIFVMSWSAVTFTASLGNYPVQAVAVVGFVGSILLGIRSLKRLFDKKTREKLYGAFMRFTDRIGERMSRIGRRIKKALGLDTLHGWGADEKDFVFGERRRRGRKRRKVYNPLYWQDQKENEEKIRYYFIEYMVGRIRDGYRLRPSKTPSELDRELASEDEEHLLFTSYEAARYSGGAEKIDDDTVRRVGDMIKGK